ncbi:MAG: hydroxyisourate hydrolase [Bacteroidota bacterium]|jgi:5-hydroxyisourate hydrolase
MSKITTHILDVSAGKPASGVNVILSRLTNDENWENIAHGITNEDGRIPGLLPEGSFLSLGTYRLHFSTGAYFQNLNTDCFYPFIEVVFDIKDTKHHHVPLLLSPYGYSTYRGS